MYTGSQLYKFDSPQKVQPRQWQAMWPLTEGKTKMALIVRQSEIDQELTATEVEMLQKMVKAVGLSQEEAWITLVPPEAPAPLVSLKPGIPLQYVVAIGLEPADLHLQAICEPYQYVELNGIKITFTHPIDHLEANKTLRESLWGTLQKMFDIV